ncbi:MAG: hypothetical protein AAGD86_15160, partial [Pseudomonadota bacterium]
MPLCGALAAVLVGAPVAAQGLTERPLNLTCVAPDAPTRTTFFSAVERAAVPDEVADPARGFAATRVGAIAWQYDGTRLGALNGARLEYDPRDATLTALRPGLHGAEHRDVLVTGLPPVSRWADDTLGEWWFEAADGGFYQLRERFEIGAFPQLLSETGCFEAGVPTEPAAGLIPYAPVSPLWSDSASKRRWLAMPDWHLPGTTIARDADGDFEFPPGTVLVKEFALGARRVEVVNQEPRLDAPSAERKLLDEH